MNHTDRIGVDEGCAKRSRRVEQRRSLRNSRRVRRTRSPRRGYAELRTFRRGPMLANWTNRMVRSFKLSSFTHARDPRRRIRNDSSYERGRGQRSDRRIARK